MGVLVPIAPFVSGVPNNAKTNIGQSLPHTFWERQNWHNIPLQQRRTTMTLNFLHFHPQFP
jgi:hypothetical protein